MSAVLQACEADLVSWAAAPILGTGTVVMSTQPTASPYGIVGDGRAARHFARYLSLSDVPHRQWTRRDGSDPAQTLAECGTVVALISDAAIEPFLRERFSEGSHRFVHFSGALTTPLAEGAHPLMTFGPELLGLEEYQALPFITEEEGRPFREIFPELPNPHYAIPRELKPFYHALCVMGGNFSVLLWRKLFREFSDTLHLPAVAAIPYLRQIFRDIERDPEAALTGPLARGDRATMARNLDALSGDPFRKIYEDFVALHGQGNA